MIHSPYCPALGFGGRAQPPQAGGRHTTTKGVVSIPECGWRWRRGRAGGAWRPWRRPRARTACAVSGSRCRFGGRWGLAAAAGDAAVGPNTGLAVPPHGLWRQMLCVCAFPAPPAASRSLARRCCSPHEVGHEQASRQPTQTRRRGILNFGRPVGTSPLHFTTNQRSESRSPSPVAQSRSRHCHSSPRPPAAGA